MIECRTNRYGRVKCRLVFFTTGRARVWTRRFLLLSLLLAATSRASDWATLAGHSARNSATAGAPAALSFELWRATTDLAGESFVFEGPASPVVFDGRVYANARQFNESGAYVANRIVAMDLESGAIAFETMVAKGVLDSWSSPSVDRVHRLVLMGSGASLFGVNADSGVVAFETPLDRSVVNASVVVADDLPFGRAFITDYTGFGGGATLYCVNTAAYDETQNPFDVGEIVWREAIGGASGATPSYRDGVVYVACTAEPTTPSGQRAGHVSAYDVDAGEGQRLLWRATLASAGVSGQGFFGGVAIAGDAIFAASYNTSGAGDNSTLVKIDATSGQIDWTIPCERTNSIPIVVGERVYLSAGLFGFGSVARVQAFDDLGASAEKAWDSYLDSGEMSFVGGWTHQPVYCEGRLYCGVVPMGFPFFGPNTDLYVLDVTTTPADAAFVVDHVGGCGSSPAVADGLLLTSGSSGLIAFATRGDVCGDEGSPDGRLTIEDAPCFAALLVNGNASPADLRRCDFNEDGVLDSRDMAAFISSLVGD